MQGMLDETDSLNMSFLEVNQKTSHVMDLSG